MTRDQFIYALTACGCLLKDGKTWYEHNELIKCFEDLGLFEQEPQKFKWCTDCREYDQEKHCCHRWSKVIRNTVEEMKQEPILDKIDEIITDALDKSTDQKESQTLRWVLDKISEVM